MTTSLFGKSSIRDFTAELKWPQVRGLTEAKLRVARFVELCYRPSAARGCKTIGGDTAEALPANLYGSISGGLEWAHHLALLLVA